MAKLVLPSSTTYRIVEKLKNQGLLVALPKNRKQEKLRPLSLSSLTRRIAGDSRKLRRLELALTDLDRFLPFTESVDAPWYEDPVEILETQEQFREHYFDLPRLCKSAEGMLAYGSMDNLYGLLGFYYGSAEENAFIKLRIAEHVPVSILCHTSRFFPAMARRNGLELRQNRLSEKISTINNFYVLGEKSVSIFLTNPRKPRALVIRQPELVESYRAQFGQHWQEASV
jgi:hypothetical protein